MERLILLGARVFDGTGHELYNALRTLLALRSLRARQPSLPRGQRAPLEVAQSQGAVLDLARSDESARFLAAQCQARRLPPE